MRKFYQTLSILLFLFCAKIISAQSYTENFDNITTLLGNGWFQQNNSSPVGGNPVWFQGTPTTASPDPGPFNAYNGAVNAYIAVNFASTSGGTGIISNWLVTPNRTLRNGDVFTFYTRKPTIGAGQTDYPDRLEVRMSTNGASTNVGSGATAVGDFTTLLLSVNPTLTVNVYPQAWTQFTITISGLPAPTSGRIAFRYFVTNAGPSGSNSDYIGIDNVVYTPYVCPAFTITPGGALAGGVAGTTYSKTLTQSGALGTPGFAITAGALPPGLSLSASGIISGTPTATGTFNFSVTVNDASGCSGSQSYSITVACPSNPISINEFPQLCSNNGLYTLTEGLPAGGAYSGIGVSSGQFDPAAGTQTITYNYTDVYGCSYTLSKTITVNTAPTVTLNAFPTLCSSSILYNLTGGLPAGGTYSGTGVSGGQFNPTAGTQTITYTYTDANGCTSSDSKTITVNPALAITAHPTASIICTGANTTFSATVSNATGYQWQVNTGSGFNNVSNGGVYSGATTSTLMITGATAGMNGYVYKVLATGATGCNPVTSNNAALTVNSALSITGHPSASSICSGSNTTFSVTASNATSYQWQVNTGSGFNNVSNGGIYSGATTATLAITGASAGLNGYAYQVLVTGACTPVITSNIAPLIVSSTAAPTGQAIQSFNEGDHLSVLVVNGQNIKWYATSADAMAHINVLPSTTVIVNNTTYYATQTMSSCESLTPLAVKAYNESLSINDVEKNSAVILYPNPVKDILSLHSDLKIQKVIITETSGKKVSEKNMNGEKRLNVHTLAQGTYLISIFTEKGVQTIKFIKD